MGNDNISWRDFARGVMFRHRIALVAWLVTFVFTVVTVCFSTLPDRRFGEGHGAKLATVVAWSSITALVAIIAIALTAWAFCAPKVVEVDGPAIAALARLNETMDEVRTRVEEVHAAHQGLHPAGDLERHTEPR